METQFLKDRVWGVEGLRILLWAGFIDCPWKWYLVGAFLAPSSSLCLVLPLRPTLKNVW